MNIQTVYGLTWIASRARINRKRLFFSLFKPTKSTRILDIGGTQRFWEYIVSEIPEARTIAPILLNLNLPKTKTRYQYIQADALDMPFQDRSFDIVFANSLIDHLHTFDKQMALAREIQRVGKNYFVQTPNRWFPIEPHYLTPFVHYLPKNVQRKLLRNFSVWGWITRPSRNQVNRMVEEIKLSSKKEFQKLFPEAVIHTERMFGMPKAFIAYKM